MLNTFLIHKCTKLYPIMNTKGKLGGKAKLSPAVFPLSVHAATDPATLVLEPSGLGTWGTILNSTQSVKHYRQAPFW